LTTGVRCAFAAVFPTTTTKRCCWYARAARRVGKRRSEPAWFVVRQWDRFAAQLVFVVGLAGVDFVDGEAPRVRPRHAWLWCVTLAAGRSLS